VPLLSALADRCAWIAGLLFAGAAAAQGAAGAAKFLEEAIRGNLAEVRMGELAQQRGKSNEARDFGKQLVSDHKMALGEAGDVGRAAIRGGGTVFRDVLPVVHHHVHRELSIELLARELRQHLVARERRRPGAAPPPLQAAQVASSAGRTPARHWARASDWRTPCIVISG
jgi:hypothetical protein